MKQQRAFRTRVRGPVLTSIAVILAVGAAASSAAVSAVVTRGPYLQSGTPTGVTVRWRTDVPTDSRVRYGRSPGSLTSTADHGASTREHVVALEGLEPDTVYYYSVGSTAEVLAGDDAEHFFRTSPSRGTRRPVRTWVLGDSGTGNSDARRVRDAYYAFNGDTHTDLWLMLGDNAYSDGTDSEYQDALFDTYPRMLRQSVLWPTLGNHDGRSADSDTESGVYYDIFTLPTAGEAGGVASGTEAYYSFDFANIHFICMNSYDVSRSLDGPMMTWLEQDVMNTTQDWVIAFWHHPPYSKGSHDSDSESKLRDMREIALPILEDWGVDIVFAGHSHSYERSFLLDGHYGRSDTLTDGMMLDAGDGRPDGNGAYRKDTPGPAGHEGAVYTVAGSSGKTSSGSLDHPAMYLSLKVLGSVVLDVDGDRLDAKFIDDDGAFRDYFTIVKGAGGGPRADFSASPTSGPAPLTVQFTDLSSADVVSWRWDFDADGTVDSTERNPSHVYSAPGSYTVRLTVSNPSGSDSKTRPDYIVVREVGGTTPPAVQNLRRIDTR